ncbi:multidrug ABC transporter permease [Paenibacillus cisolokensis]|uniref:Multidrug ABC transporter permease n=1 Tax=Paenibacillus cisolokensis TaxID=1658519 RepID=A0ABQ4N4E2_9BACL|nr:lantibiotic immunity ABC transporter MutG family permease subunit [Paenibacillus cisolokensis]GIQ63022.1 multidrug ABC transporter permease [Paenibacillus cisolokensis]
MTLLRILRTDWLITKRTGYRWLVFAAPPLAAGILLWYFSGRPLAPGLANAIYEAFSQMTASALPLAIGLLAGMLAMQEEQAGCFGGLLGRQQPRALSFAGKLLMVTLPVGFGIFAAALLLVFGMETLLGIADADAGLFLAGAAYTTIGSLTLCVFHLFLALAFGMGASAAAGGAGFLLAAIVGATVVGDRIWEFVPWAWPVRLSQFPLLARLSEFQNGTGTSAFELYCRQVDGVLLMAVASFIVASICGTIWFVGWEGRKTYE